MTTKAQFLENLKPIDKGTVEKLIEEQKQKTFIHFAARTKWRNNAEKILNVMDDLAQAAKYECEHSGDHSENEFHCNLKGYLQLLKDLGIEK